MCDEPLNESLFFSPDHARENRQVEWAQPLNCRCAPAPPRDEARKRLIAKRIGGQLLKKLAVPGKGITLSNAKGSLLQTALSASLERNGEFPEVTNQP
jgi:hypothetical protein